MIGFSYLKVWFSKIGLIIRSLGLWSDQNHLLSQVSSSANEIWFQLSFLDLFQDCLLVLDYKGEVLVVNEAAKPLIGGRFNQRYFLRDILPPSWDVLSLLAQVQESKKIDLIEFKYQGDSDEFIYAMTLCSLTDQIKSDVPASYLVILKNITATARFQEMQKEFVANVSHELRTPLTGIIGFIETLRDSAKEDIEAQKLFLTMMNEQALRMKRLINDLLMLSAIESNQNLIYPSNFDLVVLLKNLMERFKPLAEQQDMVIVFNYTIEKAPIYADADRIEEVYENLLQNALKYGKRGTPVEIDLTLLPNGQYCVVVKDHGIGIPEDSISLVTQRFYRVDSNRSRALGGTGLGLAIVKHILIRHKGRLEIKSQINRGSSFITYLPCQHNVF